MSLLVSRRRWLLGAAAGTAALSRVVADPPATPSGHRLALSSLPIPSRTIELDSPGKARTVVTAIAADPRGELLAAAGDDHSIRILRTMDLSTVLTLGGHRDVIRTVTFDPTGSKLVSAGNDGQLNVWDRDQSFHLQQTMHDTPALARVKFAPDGLQLAAVGFDYQVFIINRGDRQQAEMRCSCQDLRAVAYRDDSQRLAVAGRSGSVHLFDPRSGLLLSEHSVHQGRVHDLAFQRKSNVVVSVGEDGDVALINTTQEKLVRRIHVTTGKLFALAILDAPLIAVAGSDNLIRIVDTNDGTVIRKLKGHEGSVASLTSMGGMLFSGGYDATLRRWNIDVDSSQQRIAEGDLNFDR